VVIITNFWQPAGVSPKKLVGNEKRTGCCHAAILCFPFPSVYPVWQCRAGIAHGGVTCCIIQRSGSCCRQTIVSPDKKVFVSCKGVGIGCIAGWPGSGTKSYDNLAPVMGIGAVALLLVERAGTIPPDGSNVVTESGICCTVPYDGTGPSLNNFHLA
jgi:hypothetical protein